MKIKKVRNNFSIVKNSVVDKGDGVIEFSKPLVITDGSDQRNGTNYDIKTMDISEYDDGLTVNHGSDVEDIIGNTFGIKKSNKEVTIDGIKFAVKESARAIFVYNMILGGFVKDFSVETLGPWPDDEGVYYNSKLIGLSVVVKGNNKSATLSKITKNSIDQAEKNGLSTDSLKKDLHIDNTLKICNKYTMKIKVINNRNFSVTVNYTKKNGEKVEKELAPNSFIMVAKDYQTEIEAQIKNAVEPQKNSLEDAVKNAVTPLMNKIADLEKKIETNSAQEPPFKQTKAIEGELNSMDYRDRHGKQILSAWNALKGGNMEAFKQLRDINAFHLDKLKEAGIARNSVTIEDFGNFVISPELIKEIEGVRSNYQPLLSQISFKDTLSLQMAWLKRSGDIDMTEVEMCDDDADGNLKPIKEYGASIQTSNLQELAAVTPVCNAATRFLAADLLGDVAEGYRNDFDRKKAQLFIARLQQAVDATGNTALYHTDTDIKAVKSWVELVATISGNINNGTFIISNATKWELIKTAIGSGVSGDVLGMVKSGDLSPILGAPAIVVPNDLLPTLNTAETKTFTIEGVSVSITHAVFYVELSTFTGRTSGGLQYDLSTDAAYEDSEGNVKSAYQRNELVLRGSFFRGGAIRDTDKVAALGAPGLS
jgi:HK97 family phage major capsid protein